MQVSQFDDLNKKWKNEATFLEKVTINFYRNDYAELIKLFILYSKTHRCMQMYARLMTSGRNYDGRNYDSDAVMFLRRDIELDEKCEIDKRICEDIYKVIAFHEHDSARRLKKVIEENHNIDEYVLFRPLHLINK